MARDVKVQEARDNLLAGAIFLAFGGAFAWTASTYDVGSLLSMGPGYFPLVLGLILAGLGLVIMATGLLPLGRAGAGAQAPASPAIPDDTVQADTQTTAESDERGGVPWARGGLLLLAILFFGVTVDGLGLAATLFVTVFLAALAGYGTSWRAAVVISLGLTTLSVLLFVVVLQLRLPLVGPWLGG